MSGLRGRLIPAALALLLASGAAAWARETGPDPRPGRIASLMEAYAELEQFSGAALVAEKDRILYRAGLGMANRELGVPASPEHRFVIGSMTKAFTAVLVLQEVAAGRVELDAPAMKHWPEFPDPSGGRITVRHLLAHRSGLPHWGAVDGFLLSEARLEHDPEDLVRLYAGEGLSFQPGAEESYSSPGYVVLGILLERATGKDLGDLLRQRIFEPLGMARTSLDDHATLLPGRASPYRYSFLEARYDNAEYRDPSTTWSTGGIVSTVDDLLLWSRALSAGRLLDGSRRKLLSDRDQGGAAFGWRKGYEGREEEPILWHGGQVTGFRSQITLETGKERKVILLGNLRDIDTHEITSRILDILEGGEAKMPRRSLMKEVLAVSAAGGAPAAIARHDEILEKHAEEYRTGPVELLLAAIELRSDGACDRAAPLYEHWIGIHDPSLYGGRALRDAADCRLLLGDREIARAHLKRLEEVRPDHPSLEDLRERLEAASVSPR